MAVCRDTEIHWAWLCTLEGGYINFLKEEGGRIMLIGYFTSSSGRLGGV